LPVKSHPSICRICSENCGILISRKNQKTVITGNPDHPVSRGFICFRGRNFTHIHHDPKRLTLPLLKKKAGWQEISLEQGLDVLAENLLRSKARFGPESVVFYKGEALKHQQNAHYMRHLAYGFGSPNYVSVGSLCHYAITMGHGLTYGGIPKPDFNRIRSALIWGANPAASYPRLFRQLKQAVQSGLKLLVIDPAKTRTAKLAHLHLPIRPGTDGLLALAFIQCAMDHPDLERALSEGKGGKGFKKAVKGLSLNRLLKACDISRDGFNGACTLIFQNRPACPLQAWVWSTNRRGSRPFGPLPLFTRSWTPKADRSPFTSP